ncbi:hypothetical protein [Limibacterium fermenti]|uniref:hypothetical protein n=1 Tax=Limibacterium fermenti TaxID=3229863 RepID=UPI000E8E66C9|nr:hypothetical protein [Porphyromonadaceae bacterium]HBX45046.1 hypothetical protein [Porphyromonadaceae bacterium]
MKRTGILLVVLAVSLAAFPQKSRKRVVLEWGGDKEYAKLNEVKLNLVTTIFGAYPEISYERILDSDISVGVAAGIGFDEDLYDMRFALTPHFRWFFGGAYKSLEKIGSGFFIEANGAVFSREYDDSDYNSDVWNNTTDTKTGAGLGLAIGWKYLSKNNWVGEVFLGAGRDFVNDGAYPRTGITIGKRF